MLVRTLLCHAILSDNLHVQPVESIEFECQLTWMNVTTQVKPKRPTLPFAYTSITHSTCNVDVDGIRKDLCTSTKGPNAHQLKPGVSSAERKLTVIKHVLETEKMQVTVTYYPNHPQQKAVVIVDRSAANITGNTSIEQYQLFGQGNEKLHCQTKSLRQINSSVSDYDSLHYMGTTVHGGKRLRKWAAAMKGEMAGIGLTNTAYSEFWDTADRDHLPYRIGVANTGTTEYDTLWLKEFKQNLTEANQRDWLDSFLNGNANMTTLGVACRTREHVEIADHWYKVPKVEHGQAYDETASEFYAERLAETAKSVSDAEGHQEFFEQNYQPVSYEAYWGLAMHDWKQGYNTSRTSDALKIPTDMKGAYARCQAYNSDTAFRSCTAALADRVAQMAEDTLREQMRANSTTTNATSSNTSSGRRLEQQSRFFNQPAEAKRVLTFFSDDDYYGSVTWDDDYYGSHISSFNRFFARYNPTPFFNNRRRRTAYSSSFFSGSSTCSVSGTAVMNIGSQNVNSVLSMVAAAKSTANSWGMWETSSGKMCNDMLPEPIQVQGCYTYSTEGSGECTTFTQQLGLFASTTVPAFWIGPFEYFAEMSSSASITAVVSTTGNVYLSSAGEVYLALKHGKCWGNVPGVGAGITESSISINLNAQADFGSGSGSFTPTVAVSGLGGIYMGCTGFCTTVATCSSSNGAVSKYDCNYFQGASVTASISAPIDNIGCNKSPYISVQASFSLTVNMFDFSLSAQTQSATVLSRRKITSGPIKCG
jgi:hypothetical protein